MQLDWDLPKKKQSPLYMLYSPASKNLSQNFVNPFLGYPTSPIIGRYNRGQYKIGQTLFQLEFKCKYNEDRKRYECGEKALGIPEQMLHNLRHIPEVIVNNKAAGIKNSPEVLPQKYPVLENVSVYWIVSFGQLGKDFLNYLNHMYVLAPYLFTEQKLKRNVHFLPIYAFLPEFSGLNDFQVERGLNYQNYRGQYMSLHLAKGAPAFSPNNMRLSILGGKIITSKQPQKQNQEKKQKQKKKFISKEEYEQFKLKQKERQEKQLEEKVSNEKEKQESVQEKQEKQKQICKEVKQEKEDIQQNPLPVNLAEKCEQQKKLEEKAQEKKKQQKKNQKQKMNNQPPQPKLQHQGFIHFYTSVLLQNDYRVYYHWHIEDRFKQELIKQIWTQSTCVEDFTTKYANFAGKDFLSIEVNNLLFPHGG